jgi:hypothetical protein
VLRERQERESLGMGNCRETRKLGTEKRHKKETQRRKRSVRIKTRLSEAQNRDRETIYLER